MSTEESNSVCTQTFVALDRWLNHVGREKGDKALEVVRSAMRNNLDANITYYEAVAKGAELNGNLQFAARYKLLVSLYRGLLG